MVIDIGLSESAAIASDILKEGKLAILPTDTIYGISAIVQSDTPPYQNTARAICALKGRRETKPFIRLIESPKDILEYTLAPIPKDLLDLWPAALSIIVPLKGSQATVAFRCPSSPWLRRVIGLCGSPIYSTSVNPSGAPFLTDISSIIQGFASKVGLIVNGGNLRGEPSTIVSCNIEGTLSLVRQGSLKLSRTLVTP